MYDVDVVICGDLNIDIAKKNNGIQSISLYLVPLQGFLMISHLLCFGTRTVDLTGESTNVYPSVNKYEYTSGEYNI